MNNFKKKIYFLHLKKLFCSDCTHQTIEFPMNYKKTDFSEMTYKQFMKKALKSKNKKKKINLIKMTAKKIDKI